MCAPPQAIGSYQVVLFARVTMTASDRRAVARPSRRTIFPHFAGWLHGGDLAIKTVLAPIRVSPARHAWRQALSATQMPTLDLLASRAIATRRLRLVLIAIADIIEARRRSGRHHRCTKPGASAFRLPSRTCDLIALLHARAGHAIGGTSRPMGLPRFLHWRSATALAPHREPFAPRHRSEPQSSSTSLSQPRELP